MIRLRRLEHVRIAVGEDDDLVLRLQPREGWTGDPGSFVTWWRRTHFENSMIDALLHKTHTPYREIGHAAVAYTMDRAGITYTPEEVRYLVVGIDPLVHYVEYGNTEGRPIYSA